jgi:hypothetical protein
LLGLVAATCLWRLIRFPAPFLIGSRIEFFDFECAVDDVQAVEVLDDVPGLLIRTKGGDTRLLVDDERYPPEDLQWIADSILARVQALKGTE